MHILSVMFFGLLGLALSGVSVIMAAITILALILAYSYVISKGISIKEKTVLVGILVFIAAWGGFLTYLAGHFGLLYLTTQ